MSSELNGSLGATEIGSVLGAFLFGVETLQTYNYFRNFHRDSILLKTTVSTFQVATRPQRSPSSGCRIIKPFASSVIHSAQLYSQTVTFYGQPQYVSSPPISEEFTILCASLLYAVVQTFFANRVRVLSGNWHVLAVASILSTLRFIANMGSLGLLLHYRRVSILLDWRWLVTTALSLGLTVDILITLSMCYFLQKMRSSESKRCVWRASGIIMVANGWIGRVPW
ncbi:hypothetical protein B0H13DRAFT_1633095 [Mycena leptocephala]|nr:hypothetical protein B0H13DRAFT_1633095 [Mycena leptocephala]